MGDNSGGSVAPKERVNIVYKSSTGNAQEEVELPFKQLVLGDFTLRQSDVPIEERQAISIDKTSFDAVLKAHDLLLECLVPDRLTEKSETEEADMLPVTLKFNSLRDFEPDAIVEQVPQLRSMSELRSALRALKAPLGNLPEFRKHIQSLIKDESVRSRLMGELNLQGEE